MVGDGGKTAGRKEQPAFVWRDVDGNESRRTLPFNKATVAQLKVHLGFKTGVWTTDNPVFPMETCAVATDLGEYLDESDVVYFTGCPVLEIYTTFHLTP